MSGRESSSATRCALHIYQETNTNTNTNTNRNKEIKKHKYKHSQEGGFRRAAAAAQPLGRCVPHLSGDTLCFQEHFSFSHMHTFYTLFHFFAQVTIYVRYQDKKSL